MAYKYEIQQTEFCCVDSLFFGGFLCFQYTDHNLLFFNKESPDYPVKLKDTINVS